MYHQNRSVAAMNSIHGIDQIGASLCVALNEGKLSPEEAMRQGLLLDKARAKLEFKQSKAEEINERAIGLYCWFLVIPICYYCAAYCEEYPGDKAWRRMPSHLEQDWFLYIKSRQQQPSRAVMSREHPNHVVAKIHKDSPGQRVGIAVKRAKNGDVLVWNLSPTSPFMHTDLKVGMKLIKINNILVGGDDMDFVISLLRQTEGELTVVAEDSDHDKDAGQN